MDGGAAIKPMSKPHGVCRDENLKDWFTSLRARQYLRDEIERRP
jgi:hypothetical protein